MGDPNPTTTAEAPTQAEVENPPTQPDLSTAIPSPNSNPGAVVTPPPPPSIVTPPPPLLHPSFRPPVSPQLFPASGYPNMPPGVVGPPQPQPYGVASQAVRYVAPPMPNGYPLAGVPPPGVSRYPNPYAPMIRPGFPPRPMVGVMPPLARPPIIGIRGPIVAPVVRPLIVASASPAEEPQKTVYVGKLQPTVENDFMLSLLQLCGPVKSWKRPHGPTGALRGFGFCEFEYAEGVLRALRLLNKLSVDGQELMLNVGDETREYLKRYVEKRIESTQNGEGSKAEGTEKEDSSASGDAVNKTMKLDVESPKPSSDELEKDESKANKLNPDAADFGIVTNEDREADREAREKITSMIEERLKNKPIPPPPPQRDVDASRNINSEQRSGSRDREAENVAKNEDLPSEDEKNAESKPSNEPEKTETDSPDRSRRRERSRDRDRDGRRDKERELERYEREREQERAKREKEREYKSREDERRYKMREKEWETREREREHWRKREREREKERAQERKWEVMDQERGDDDGYGKKRKYRTSDEERKRRQREREDDWADRLREEEEIIEAKRREEEERLKKEAEALKATTVQQPANGPESQEANEENEDKEDQTFDNEPSRGFPYAASDEGIQQNGTADESAAVSNAALDVPQNNNAPTSRKLGFGLSGSGKRAAVPSVFNADEDEDAHKEKKMRPLVPIDYTSEEQATKEEKPDVENDKSRRSHERSGHRDRHEEETSSIREARTSRTKTPENQKLEAKQLIDTIPKTKDDLFSYKINWSIYDQNVLHEQLRPWVSKKITDYLGEEEVALVDYIVSSTQEHVDAAEMLERLQTILDDEAEMFVLKMWRMLIFEIKKVENGLAVKSRS